jgi:hypothetical protein
VDFLAPQGFGKVLTLNCFVLFENGINLSIFLGDVIKMKVEHSFLKAVRPTFKESIPKLRRIIPDSLIIMPGSPIILPV